VNNKILRWSIVLFSVTGNLIPVSFADSQSKAYSNTVTTENSDENVTSSPLPQPSNDGIDYKNAKPMPMPSIDAPINSDALSDNKDLDSTGISHGNEGTGQQNPRVLINPIKIEPNRSD
jgi:hypothetical protein